MTVTGKGMTEKMSQ